MEFPRTIVTTKVLVPQVGFVKARSDSSDGGDDVNGCGVFGGLHCGGPALCAMEPGPVTRQQASL